MKTNIQGGCFFWKDLFFHKQKTQKGGELPL